MRFASGHGHSKSAVEVARQTRVTLNDMPVPSGSWQENYSKRNAKWNMLLAAATLVFATTAFAVCFSGICSYNRAFATIVKTAVH